MHAHKVQEQIYHVLDGEGLMRIGETARVVRRHDVVFLPPACPTRSAIRGWWT
jgi:uncharacterized cupin superfamily protein